MPPIHASQPALSRTSPVGEYAPPPAAPQPLSPASSLAAAMQAYHAYPAGAGYSAHTVKAFIHDVSLLARLLGLSRPIGKITTRDLERLLACLEAGRGKPRRR